MVQCASTAKKEKEKAINIAGIDDDELRLIKYLFGGKYNREVRPVRNKSEPVTVIVDLAYTQLVNLVRT